VVEVEEVVCVEKDGELEKVEPPNDTDLVCFLFSSKLSRKIRCNSASSSKS
jgi:hypothetical protein